nr:hypothetical protein [Tanacetum cinerariifolium]
GFVDKFVRDPNKIPDSSQRPPHDCLKCGNPVDGLYCQQGALLRKKLKEDPGENSSQSPPHIDHHCCYGCGDSLNGIFCQRCTCESCGNGAHIGYNCPSKVPIIFNLKPCHNQNVDEFPQTLPIFHPTFYSGDKNSFAYDSTPNFVDDPPNIFNPPPQPLMDSYEFYGNDAHYSYDYYMQELIQKLFNDVQNINEELAEYINTPSWNRPAFYSYDDDDDEDYTIAIIPEEPVDSLIMKDEHLDTILAMKSDEVIKSSVEELVPIPSESEGIPDNICDVPFRDNSPPLDISKDQFEEFFDSNDDSTSIDDDYFSIHDIDYVEASPPDSELVSLEESPSLFPILVEDSDSFWEKSDTSLFYLDNSLPEFETFSDHTKEMNSGSTTTHADYSLPEYVSFLFKIEIDQDELTSVVMEDILGEPQKNSSSTTIHADISLSDIKCFYFKSEPDLGYLTSIIDFGIRENVLSTTNVNLSPEDDQSPLFAYVIWIFLTFLMYLVAPPYLLSSENEDTIFDPDISIYHSLLPTVSHRSRTFMKFNVYPKPLNESPMEILSSTCFPMDQ